MSAPAKVIILADHLREKLARLADDHLDLQENLHAQPASKLIDHLKRLDDMGVEIEVISMRIKPHARFQCSDCGRKLDLQNTASDIGFGALCRDCARRGV